MMSASECMRELLERIAAGDGADTRGELKEDAEGARAEFLGEDLGLVIGHHGGHESHLRLDAGHHRPAAGLPREGRGDSTAARRGITRVRADPDPPLPLDESRNTGEADLELLLVAVAEVQPDDDVRLCERSRFVRWFFVSLRRIVEVGLHGRLGVAEPAGDLRDRQALLVAVMARQRDRSPAFLHTILW